jgi:hypothetical protein
MSLTDDLYRLVNSPQPVPGSAHARVTVTSTASNLTTLGYSAVATAKGYLLQVTGSGAVVRYCIDGSTPTASQGFRLTEGTEKLLNPGDHSLAKFILEAGTPVLELQAVR